MDEVLKIQQQAAQIKLQIDRLKGRATALERLSELATITAKLQAAEAVLGRDYIAVRSQLRQAEAQRAAQLLALKRAKTPEEENKIRDVLGELAVQIDRANARLNELAEKARLAEVALPTPPADEAAQTAPAQELPDQFIATRIRLRQAEARQAEITRRLRLSLPAEEQAALRDELSKKILEINGLNAQLKSIQERATQLGVTLPTLSPEQEAALAGTAVELPQPDPIRAIATAWDASLNFLRGALAIVLGAVVFVWWALPLLVLVVVLFLRGGVLRSWNARRATPAPAAAEVEAPRS
jgi:hypothetical protein